MSRARPLAAVMSAANASPYRKMRRVVPMPGLPPSLRDRSASAMMLAAPPRRSSIATMGMMRKSKSENNIAMAPLSRRWPAG